MTVATLALVLVLLAIALAASVAMAPIWRRRATRARRDLDSGPGGSLLHVRSTPGPVRTTDPRGPVTAPEAPQPGPTAGRGVRRVTMWAWRHRAAARWGPAVCATATALVGLLAAGPVAGAVLGAYGAAGFVLVRGMAVRRSQQRAYRMASDAVVGLAADLRAGATLAPAWQVAQEALREARAGVLPGWRAGSYGAETSSLRSLPCDPAEDRSGVAVIEHRLAAAATLAEASGAPLADLLDRLDVHLRAVDRARAVARGQAAGARASAALLAAMPVAGLGLGAVVGVDPWRVLLHTAFGAAALGLAVALQLLGLMWAGRLAETRVAL